MEWVLDTHYAQYFNKSPNAEWSVIVQGSMEATLTPLMEQIEADFAGIKVFSLPSVDSPKYGRHIELGVKGEPELVKKAYPAMVAGLGLLNATLLDELKRWINLHLKHRFGAWDVKFNSQISLESMVLQPTPANGSLAGHGTKFAFTLFVIFIFNLEQAYD